MDPVVESNGQMPEVMPPKTPSPGDGAQAGPVESKPEVQTVDKAALQALVEENARAKGYVVALTRELAAMREQPREPELPPRERQQAIKELLNDDPELALDAHFRERVAPIVKQNNQTLASINRERAIDKIGKAEWGKWGTKVEEFLQPFDEATRAEPNAYENAYNLVRLQHVDEIIEERMRAKQQEQQRQTLLEGSSSNAAASRSNRELTSLEKQMAKNFNMTDEEWRKFGSSPLKPAEEQ